MLKLAVNRLLTNRKFALDRTTILGDTFSAPLNEEFRLIASCPFATSMDLPNQEAFHYGNVELYLSEGGQHHRFRLLAPFEREIDAVLTELKAIGQDPAIITCPLCGAHYVIPLFRESDNSSYLGCNAWIEEADSKEGHWCQGERPGVGLLQHWSVAQ